MAATLAECARVLRGQAGVLAVVVGGSQGDGADIDAWSDLDLVVVVREGCLPAPRALPEWLGRLGPVFATDRSAAADRFTLRVCFADLRRVDFVFVPERELAAFLAAPGPLSGGGRVLWDQTDRLADLLRVRPPETAPDPAESDAAFRRLDAELHWAGVLAAVRLGRNDLLIAAHLALEMAQSCLVLGMLLRDRATGTRHHRHGEGAASPALRVRPPAALTAAEIADAITAAAESWHELATEWDPAYARDLSPLRALVERAREGATRP